MSEVGLEVLSLDVFVTPWISIWPTVSTVIGIILPVNLVWTSLVCYKFVVSSQVGDNYAVGSYRFVLNNRYWISYLCSIKCEVVFNFFNSNEKSILNTFGVLFIHYFCN